MIVPPRSTAIDPAPGPGTGSIIGLDIVRFLAALCVVLYHYAFFSWHEVPAATGVRAAIGTPVAYPVLIPFSWWGWVGVEIFFVISGLVICMSADRQSAAAFLRGRFLRLAPALWFFATLTLLATLIYSSATLDSLAAMYVRSLVLFPQGPWIDGVYWTLTIEVVFYALMLALIAFGWLARLRTLALFASLGVLAFHLMVVAARLRPELAFAPAVLAAADAYVSRVILLTTGAYFLVGVNLRLVFLDGWTPRGAAALGASLAAGSIGLWLAAEGTPAVILHARSPATPVGIWLGVVALLALALSFHRAGRGSPRMRRLSRSAGLASYPLYLFHNICGALFFGLLLDMGVGRYAALALAILFCVVISVGFAVWIEPSLARALGRRLLHWRTLLPVRVTSTDVKGWDRT